MPFPLHARGGGTLAGALAIASTSRDDGHFDHPEPAIRDRSRSADLCAHGGLRAAPLPGNLRSPRLGVLLVVVALLGGLLGGLARCRRDRADRPHRWLGQRRRRAPVRDGGDQHCHHHHGDVHREPAQGHGRPVRRTCGSTSTPSRSSRTARSPGPARSRPTASATSSWTETITGQFLDSDGDVASDHVTFNTTPNEGVTFSVTNAPMDSTTVPVASPWETQRHRVPDRSAGVQDRHRERRDRVREPRRVRVRDGRRQDRGAVVRRDADQVQQGQVDTSPSRFGGAVWRCGLVV